MANVFIYSIDDATTRAYGDSPMNQGYELEAVMPFIQEEGKAEYLRRIYPDGQCYVWGAQESGHNLSTWRIMGEDDLVLGYNNHSIVSASYVLTTMQNPSVATRLWGSSKERPFSLLCFTNKPYTGEVPIVVQMSRYLDEDYPGFTMLNRDKSDNIVGDYGALETFVRLGLRYDFPFVFRHSE